MIRLQDVDALLAVGGRDYRYVSLPLAARSRLLPGIDRLPFCLKVLLENVLRAYVEGKAPIEDVTAFADWLKNPDSGREIGYRPSRLLMPDSSGIPFMGDLAAMRDAMARLGGDPASINPAIDADLVVDHSVIVENFGTPTALQDNMAAELEHNRERFSFLKWAAGAFDNLRVVPPGNGICHQVNVEYLARVVTGRERDGVLQAFPDTLLGMDSHTPTINALGIVGWGTGGLEAMTAALGEPTSILLPPVVGCRLEGRLRPGITATDLVLTVAEAMRTVKVVGKFVEYCGPGLDSLPLTDRATVANMTPETGATMGFFPIDAETLRFLKVSGRSAEQVALVEAYAKAQGLWRDSSQRLPVFTSEMTIDLSAVEPSMAGPKRPNERRTLSAVPASFRAAHPEDPQDKRPAVSLRDGDIVMAAITSCTNTSNPAVMLGAGLLARNARRRGLTVKPWVKTSLSPGSRVVADYLDRSGLQADLDALGFNVAGYGCMTCMGNSGPLPDAVRQQIEQGDRVAVAVLSGNRNFEGRVHQQIRANYLASPPLVVAYALAGTILHDMTTAPIGTDQSGKPVFLEDIWPDTDELNGLIDRLIAPDRYERTYAKVLEGSQGWNALPVAAGSTFAWDPNSSFIRRPPLVDDTGPVPEPVGDIRGARALALLGDMITTDHISPVGGIGPTTSAGRYLQEQGVAPKDFVSYMARRLNHDVMIRGTFANIRIRNELMGGREGGLTKHMPSGEEMTMFDAAMRYRREGVPLVVVAGGEYGAGSSRDWAAKGARLLGVRAVIAESFERIHRANLVNMGVLPLQLPAGVTRQTLGLDATETYDLLGLDAIKPRMTVRCLIHRADGSTTEVDLLARLDVESDAEYFRQGGVMPFTVRRRLEQGRKSA